MAIFENGWAKRRLQFGSVFGCGNVNKFGPVSDSIEKKNAYSSELTGLVLGIQIGSLGSRLESGMDATEHRPVPTGAYAGLHHSSVPDDGSSVHAALTDGATAQSALLSRMQRWLEQRPVVTKPGGALRPSRTRMNNNGERTHAVGANKWTSVSVLASVPSVVLTARCAASQQARRELLDYLKPLWRSKKAHMHSVSTNIFDIRQFMRDGCWLAGYRCVQVYFDGRRTRHEAGRSYRNNIQPETLCTYVRSLEKKFRVYHQQVIQDAVLREGRRVHESGDNGGPSWEETREAQVEFDRRLVGLSGLMC